MLCAGFAGPALASFGDPLTGAGGPSAFHPLYVGTDARFQAADGALDWAYLGTSEPNGACDDQVGYYFVNDPYCRFGPEAGRAVLHAELDDVKPKVYDLRAGFGVGYELRQRCADQPVSSRPLFVNFTVWAYPTLSSSSGGYAKAEVWANAQDGRGGATGEGPLATNDLVARWTAPSGDVPPLDVVHPVRLDPPPLLGEHAALAYGRAYAEYPTGTGRKAALADLDLHVPLVTFEWADDKAPTVGLELRADDGTVPTPVSTRNGIEWYRKNLTQRYEVDDDYSCPKLLHAWPGPQTFPIDFNKSPVAIRRDQDGKYFTTAYAYDHQDNLATRSRDFAIDRAPPVLSFEVRPTQGNNGWINSTSAPWMIVSCQDATAGCWKAKWRWQTDHSFTTSESFPIHTHALGQQGALNFYCEAWDHSEYHTSAGCPVLVKWDHTPPTGTSRCAPSLRDVACVSTLQWAQDPATVTLTCSDQTFLSGCWFVNWTVDGGASGSVQGNQASFALSGEGPHFFNVTRTDVAGNLQRTAHAISLDGGPPTKAWVRETHGVSPIGDDPKWEWGAEDNLSGVGRYVARLNGVEVQLSSWRATNVTVWEPSDGWNCMVVTAYDQAGNAGEDSDPACVFVDQTRPTATIVAPTQGGVYRNGERLVQAAGPTVSLGRTVLRTSADDGAGSGVARHHTLLDGLDWTPLEGSSECPTDGTVCTQTHRPAEPGWRRFTVKARDLAGNDALDRSIWVAMVDIVAYSGATSIGAPYAHIEWLPWSGPGAFQRYEVHRLPSADIPPTDLTRIATLTSASSLAWRDKGVTHGAELYYVVVAHGVAPDGTPVMRETLRYLAKIPMEISAPIVQDPPFGPAPS